MAGRFGSVGFSEPSTTETNGLLKDDFEYELQFPAERLRRRSARISDYGPGLVDEERAPNDIVGHDETLR